MSDADTTVDADALDETVLDDDAAADDGGNLFATIASSAFLFFLIFGLSATVEIKNLRKQLTNRFAIGCGVAMQFFIMPVLGFLAVLALDSRGLTEAMGITLLVVTSSPGGSYSNWWYVRTRVGDHTNSVATTRLYCVLRDDVNPGSPP